MTRESDVGPIARPSQTQTNFFQRTSITSIPRPVSGTSRRASSSLFATTSNNDNFESRPDNFSSPRPHRLSRAPERSMLTNERMPPSSFSFPRAMLPRSDSLLPYKDRPKIDLSGMQEQLPVRDLVTETIKMSPDRTSLPPPNARQITPRTLMRPIPPPLPRSQTTGNLVCFPGGRDISPSKPPRKSSLAHSLTQNNGSQLDVVDALLESRMSKPEIRLFDTVKKEALTNQVRLNSNRCIPPRRTEISRSPTNTPISAGEKPSLSLNLSINDVTNIRRLEEQYQTTVRSGRRPLFVNTTLANTVRAPESPPLTCSTPGTGTTYVTLSSTEPSLDPRHVYQAEGTTYWTGRYVATTDRIRKADCKHLLEQKDVKRVDINSSMFETLFDEAEETRATRVLEDLRQCCKSEEAKKSLVKFETQLKKKLAKPQPSFIRSYSDVFQRFNQEESKVAKVPDLKKEAHHYSSNKVRDQLSFSNGQSTLERLSGFVSRKGGLTKSKTTGDLALKQASKRAPTPGFVTLSGRQKNANTIMQAQKSFQPRLMGEAHERVVREREEALSTAYGSSVQTGMEQSLMERTGRTFSNAENISIESVTNTGQPRSLHRAVRVDNLQKALLGQVQNPPLATGTSNRPSFSTASEFGNTWTASHGGIVRETILYQQPGERKSSGQKSGEFVKKVVGAGIREVRKMSRRVGSIGLSSSCDDLPEVNNTADKN